MVKKYLTQEFINRYESPQQKNFGGVAYVWYQTEKTKSNATRYAVNLRKHGVPARVWKNEVGLFAVYGKKTAYYKATSEYQKKKDYGSNLAFGKRKEKNTRMFNGKEFTIYINALTADKIYSTQEKISKWADTRVTQTKQHYRLWYRQRN